MAKTKRSPARAYPFPLVGAGEATYFEWAEVHVRFARPPRPAERKKISAKVPPPLRDSVDFTGRDLMVASDQVAHVHIAETYARDDDPDDDDDDDDDEYGSGRFFFASEAAVARFNADIEAWLHHAHALVPIVVAFRREDSESGGTALSAWHRASVKQAPQILAEFADVLAASGEDAPGSHAARGIVEAAIDARVAVPAAWRDWLESEES